MDHGDRTDLFISYAWEDAPIAQWVARKLISCGYHVWMDRLKLYGGCVWPDDIDEAIKKHAFRMIHVLSRKSISKTNPKNELQLGYMLSQKIPGFLIPLNTEGIPPIELPWQMPAIEFIDFREWDCGFAELLRALELGGCPRFDVDDGARRAIESYMPKNVILNTPETLYSNVYKFLEVPGSLKKFRTQMPLIRDEFERVTRGVWPAWFISNYECIAFTPPPNSVLQYSRYEEIESYKITDVKTIGEIKTYDICKRLLEKSVRFIAMSKKFSSIRGDLIFPNVEGGKKFFSFISHDGNNVRVQPHGYKTVRGVRINYSLGFSPKVLQFNGEWYVIISLRICMFDNQGKLVDVKKIPSYRKAITVSWYNWEWFVRHMAITSKLADGTKEWRLELASGTCVRISAIPETGTSVTSLDDKAISVLSKERNSDAVNDAQILDATADNGGQI